MRIRASTTTKPGYSGKQPFKDRPRPHQPKNSCSWCGKTPTHGRRLCPAKEAICSKCHKKGHYTAVCLSAVQIGGVQTSDNPADMHDVFIGTVVGRTPEHCNPWTATLNLNDKHVLEVKGRFTTKLKFHDKQATVDVYVVTGLHHPLLGRPAIEKLDLALRVSAIDEQVSSPLDKFPQLTKGLGKPQGDYTNRL